MVGVGYVGQPVTSFVMLSLRLLAVAVAVVAAAAHRAARGARRAPKTLPVVQGSHADYYYFTVVASSPYNPAHGVGGMGVSP